ncbi:MAG TPA: trimethylamine methyltransferase family protein [Terriglobales bacterium]|nr:trimethylamine methyltransferase family protein [Terriglobales bacterium]
MRPRLELLDAPLLQRVLDEAFALLRDRGVRITAPRVLELLRAAGAEASGDVVRLPESLIRKSLATAPHEFFLYDRAGRPAVRYGGDAVHFDPGSSCLNILDAATGRPRPALAADLVRLVQVAEALPQYAAQATALVCNDVPSEVGDLYRLLLVLWHADKPVVTGAFSAAGLAPMLELLAAASGGSAALRAKPRAIFDVCPSPPLHWSDFAALNLVDLAAAGVPAEIISVPMAGATAPVTLAGAVTQHAAECLAGIAIHQCASPGAPVVWGTAAAIFEMRAGIAPFGAIETAMLAVACAQVGKALGLPTHAYLVASDSRLVDAQAGMESAVSATLGALAGINMISGAGMLDSLACHSVEKLVIDAEAIASAQRLLAGIEARGDTLATAAFAQAGPAGDFLRAAETRALFRSEQHFPSAVIERGVPPSEAATPADTFARAAARVTELLAEYKQPELPSEMAAAMRAIVEREGARHGLTGLPGIAHR